MEYNKNLIVTDGILAFMREGEPFKNLCKFCETHNLRKNDITTHTVNSFVRIKYALNKDIIKKFAEEYNYTIIYANENEVLSANSSAIKTLAKYFIK